MPEAVCARPLRSGNLGYKLKAWAGSVPCAIASCKERATGNSTPTCILPALRSAFCGATRVCSALKVPIIPQAMESSAHGLRGSAGHQLHQGAGFACAAAQGPVSAGLLPSPRAPRPALLGFARALERETKAHFVAGTRDSESERPRETARRPRLCAGTAAPAPPQDARGHTPAAT